MITQNNSSLKMEQIQKHRQRKELLNVSLLPLSIGVTEIDGMPSTSTEKLLVGKAGIENLISFRSAKSLTEATLLKFS